MKNKSIIIALCLSIITVVINAQGNGNFTDPRDGTLYKTVVINDKVWFAENLQATKYIDGTDIANVTSNSTWSQLTTGAYCWYLNDESSYRNRYGALYNWYAVNTGKLCPEGWHVPSDVEWTAMENFLKSKGFNHDGTTAGNKIAKSLAANTMWKPSTYMEGAIGNNLSANNKSGFCGLPGGLRHNGNFSYAGYCGYWWTSTESSLSDAWYRYITYDGENVNHISLSKQVGSSIRCVKDESTVTTVLPSILAQNSQLSEDLDKVKSVGLYLGMWSYAMVFGNPDNPLSKIMVENTLKTLDELGLPSRAKSLTCGRKKWEETINVIEDIAYDLSAAKGKKVGDFLRLESYCWTASFYLSGIEKSSDQLVIAACVLAAQTSLRDATDAAERIGVPAEVIFEGSKIGEDIIKLIPQKDKPLMDVHPFSVRLLEWETKARDSASSIILK